jgi:predicted transcriptional regulator
MTKRDKPIPWSLIEADYAKSAMSVREIARWYGITETAIRKKAKAAGWVRLEVARIVARMPAKASDPVPVVEVDAGVEPGELADRARSLTGRMMAELDAVTAHAGELEEMIAAEESDPRRRQALLKALSLSERAMTLKNLSTTLKTLNEAAAPNGKKAQRNEAGARVASGGGKFSAPPPPLRVVK